MLVTDPEVGKYASQDMWNMWFRVNRKCISTKFSVFETASNLALREMKPHDDTEGMQVIQLFYDKLTIHIVS